MKVKDLIARLQTFDQDLTVVAVDSASGVLSYAGGVYEGTVGWKEAAEFGIEELTDQPVLFISL